MRTAPRPLTGFLVFLGYLAIFYGVWIINGIDYDRINDNADTILKWYVEPLAAGAVYLVIVTSILGWWRPALFEVAKAKPRWLIIGPLFMAAAAIVGIFLADKAGTTTKMLWLILLGSLLVGFCEELASRGVLLVGFRGAWSEPKVWFLTTLCFGLLHVPNAFFGAGPAAIAQVFLAFGGGTMLYLTRRVTGTLIWAMLLHGLFDFSSFIGDPATIMAAVTPVNGILALVLVYLVLKHEKGKRLPQVGVDDPAVAANA